MTQCDTETSGRRLLLMKEKQARNLNGGGGGGGGRRDATHTCRSRVSGPLASLFRKVWIFSLIFAWIYGVFSVALRSLQDEHESCVRFERLLTWGQNILNESGSRKSADTRARTLAAVAASPISFRIKRIICCCCVFLCLLIDIRVATVTAGRRFFAARVRPTHTVWLSIKRDGTSQQQMD